ncbi:MAG: hypothetical protein IPH04_00865 [Saprospirales bacterium]|nr:hypothetical protein [Saprospirales bacterium]
MAKLTIKSGKGELRLRKSSTLVGLKAKDPKQTAGSDYVSEKFFENMGGFQVVSLQQAEGGLDAQLDDVRKKEEILVGTHVYFNEGSKNPSSQPERFSLNSRMKPMKKSRTWCSTNFTWNWWNAVPITRSSPR